MKARNKIILYVPGMFCMVLLPILFCVFPFTKTDTLHRGLQITFPAHSTGDLTMYSFESFLASQKTKTQSDYNFTGNENKDSSIFKTAGQDILNLKKNFDTTKVIHFFFPDTCKWKLFIRVVDFLRGNKLSTFVPDGNELWVIQLSKQESMRI